MKQNQKIGVILFLLCFAFSCFLTVRSAGVLIDSDASSELVLAHLLSREGGILSQNWFYSTELRVLNTQLVYAPLFRLFSDWTTVRAVGACILLALLAGSYLFMLRQAGCFTVRQRYLSACFLLLPTSVTYARIVLLHCYYVPHLAIGFCLLGLLFAVLRTGRQGEAPSRRKRGLSAFAYLALAFVSGLGGVRQAMVTFAPLLGAVAWLLLFSRGREARKKQLPSFFWALGGTAAFAAGYGVNSLVLSRWFVFKHYGASAFRLPSREQIWSLLLDLLQMLGFHSLGAVSPAVRLLSRAAVAAAALLAAAALWALFRRKNGESQPARLLEVLFPAAMAVSLPLLLFAKEYYILYFIPPLTAAIPMLTAETAGAGRRWPVRAGCAALACVILASSASTASFLLTRRGDSSYRYTGLIFEDMYITDELSGAVNFLTKNGYSFGYATYWNANVITEMTDGAVELENLNPDRTTLHPYYWLTKRAFQDPDYASGPVFLLLSARETALRRNAKPLLNTGRQVYSDEWYTIWRFDDAAAVSRYILRAG